MNWKIIFRVESRLSGAIHFDEVENLLEIRLIQHKFMMAASGENVRMLEISLWVNLAPYRYYSFHNS